MVRLTPDISKVTINKGLKSLDRCIKRCNFSVALQLGKFVVNIRYFFTSIDKSAKVVNMHYRINRHYQHCL